MVFKVLFFWLSIKKKKESLNEKFFETATYSFFVP